MNLDALRERRVRRRVRERAVDLEEDVDGRVGADPEREGPEAAARALERERRIRRPLVKANLWLQSVLAGMPRFPDDDAVEAELDREIHAAAAPGAATAKQRETVAG